MWCRECQQDVAGRPAADSFRMVCVRCKTPFPEPASSAYPLESPSATQQSLHTLLGNAETRGHDETLGHDEAIGNEETRRESPRPTSEPFAQPSSQPVAQLKSLDSLGNSLQRELLQDLDDALHRIEQLSEKYHRLDQQHQRLLAHRETEVLSAMDESADSAGGGHSQFEDKRGQKPAHRFPEQSDPELRDRSSDFSPEFNLAKKSTAPAVQATWMFSLIMLCFMLTSAFGYATGQHAGALIVLVFGQLLASFFAAAWAVTHTDRESAQSAATEWSEAEPIVFHPVDDDDDQGSHPTPKPLGMATFRDRSKSSIG